MDTYRDLKRGETGAWVSIAAYVVFSAVKSGVGYWAGSKALLADGINNLTDIMASVAVLIGLRYAQKPPDEDHPYGHFRAETIAALVASFLMAAVGLDLLWNAVKSLFAGDAPTPDPIAAWTAVVSAAGMYGVYLFNRRLARSVNNQAIMAAAADNRSDALVSAGAAAGIFGSQWGAPWLDPLAAFAVSVVILKTAWSIFSQSAHALTDGFEEERLHTLGVTIRKTPGVRRMKSVRARVYGNRVMLDVVVEVDPRLNVVESHAISDEIEKRLRKKHNIMDVHVHIEPGPVEKSPVSADR